MIVLKIKKKKKLHSPIFTKEKTFFKNADLEHQKINLSQ